MKIVVNSTNRLMMRVGIPVLHPTTVLFDRNKGTVTVERRIFFYLTEAKTVLLNSIREAHVVRRQTRKSSSYKPALTVNVGHQIELPGFDRESSKKAVQLIRDFLGAD